MRVRHALRVRHGVVHSEYTAGWECAPMRVHAHISKGRVDALELPNELGVFVVDEEARMNGGVPAEIRLGRGGVGLVQAGVVLEHGLSSPQVCGDGATESTAKRFACGSWEVDGRRRDSAAIVGEECGTARPQIHVFGRLTGRYAFRIEVLGQARVPFLGSVCLMVLSKVRGRNEDCVTCEPAAGCSLRLRDHV